AMSTAAAPFWLERMGAQTTTTDPGARAWIARVRAGAKAPPTPIAPEWRSRLRDYQVDGVSWLLERSTWAPGVCLADEMGLGKTVQAIALLEARATLGPALVVAPTSVASNWLDELARFAPALRVTAHRGSATEKQLAALGPGAVLV